MEYIIMYISIISALDSCGTLLGVTAYCPSGYHCCDETLLTCCSTGYICISGTTCLSIGYVLPVSIPVLWSLPADMLYHSLYLRQRNYVFKHWVCLLMLGPFTALYRSFLKRCTLTNKAIETIWRALSKPPQRRQGPDPRPLWLLVGTPSAFGPELAYKLRVAQPT